MTTRASIRDLVFEGGDGQIGLFIEDITGWDDTPDMRREKVEYQAAHGSFDLPGYLDARLIVIEGHCRTNNPEQQQFWRNRLASLLGDGSSAKLTVEHQGLTLWTSVRLAAATTFDIVKYGEHAMYQVQLWAANPRKFGAQHEYVTTGPADYAWHYGNFPASPKLLVAGSASGYTVFGPGGRQFRVTRPLVPSHDHTIDLATGLLTVDGAIDTDNTPIADTWTIPGGAKVAHSISFDGGGSGLVAVRPLDTYI